MHIIEEVDRRSSTVKVRDWQEVYKEIVNILENRFDFSRVREVKFRHWMDVGKVFSKIFCHKEVDKFTEIKLTIKIYVDILNEPKGTAKIEIRSKGEVDTIYPEETEFQQSLLYFTFRSIWDKFVYGWARERWKEEANQLLIDVHSTIRGFCNTLSLER